MRFFVFPTCFQPLFFRGMKKGSNDREMGRFRFWWLPCPRKKYSFLIITFFRRDEKCVSYHSFYSITILLCLFVVVSFLQKCPLKNFWSVFWGSCRRQFLVVFWNLLCCARVIISNYHVKAFMVL